MKVKRVITVSSFCLKCKNVAQSPRTKINSNCTGQMKWTDDPLGLTLNIEGSVVLKHTPPHEPNPQTKQRHNPNLSLDVPYI